MAAKRPFLPLDVSFMDDDKIVQVGVSGGWLFIAMLLACKRYGTDGTLTRPQMTRLGVDKWARTVESLIEVGLVMDISEDPNSRKTFWLPSWSHWNLLAHEREERRRQAVSAARKRWKTHSGTHAERNAERNAVDDAKKRREEKRYNSDPSHISEVVDNSLDDRLGEILRRTRDHL